MSREASALRALVILAGSFPGQREQHLRGVDRRYIEQAATEE